MMKQSHGTKSPITLRRVLTTAAVLLLFALVFVTPVAAAEGEVAQVGGNTYADLQSAINAAASGDTVKLLADIEITETKTSGNNITVASGKDITLDLNGHSITGSVAATGSYALISLIGKLKVNDTSTGATKGIIQLTHTGSDLSINSYSDVITINDGGELILDDGVIIKHNGGTKMAYGIDMLNTRGSTVTINDATIDSTYMAIRLFGGSGEGNWSLTINGGTFSGKNGGALHLQKNGVATLTVTVNGGTFTSDTRGLYIYSDGNGGSTSVVLDGGFFNAPTLVTESFTDNNQNVNIAISGGTFTTEPTEYLAEDCNVAKVDDKYIVGSSIPDLTQQTVTYTGTAASAFSEYETIYSQNGEVVTPVNVGTYNVTVYHVATDSTDKYYAETLTDGLVIEPALLTATYAGETISYGETPKLEVKVTGWQNEDTAETAEGYEAPTLTTTETAVGSYTLTPSGGSANNYAFTYVSGTLVITETEAPGEGEDTETGDAETPGTIEPEVPGTIGNVNGNTATITPPSTTGGESVITTSTDRKTTTIDAGSGVTITLTSANAVTTGADGSVIGTFNTVEAVYNEIPAELKNDQTPVSYGLIIPMDPEKVLAAGIPLPAIDATFKENVANKVAGHNGNSYNSLAMIEATYTGTGGIDIINNNLSGEVTVTFKLPASVGQKLVVFHVKDGQPPQLVSNVHVSAPVNGIITVTAKGDGFSSYVVAQDTTPTSSGSSYSQGSSVWLTESQTPTETPEQPTEKPTYSAPTDVPTTQPTATETQTPGFGVLAVLAGLGAVAVLRRK